MDGEISDDKFLCGGTSKRPQARKRNTSTSKPRGGCTDTVLETDIMKPRRLERPDSMLQQRTTWSQRSSLSVRDSRLETRDSRPARCIRLSSMYAKLVSLQTLSILTKSVLILIVPSSRKDGSHRVPIPGSVAMQKWTSARSAARTQ